MKKVIIIATAFASILIITSCNQASKKDLKDANQNFKAANKDLKEAVTDADSTARKNAKNNWMNFKAQSDSSILVMNKRVDTIKLNIAKANKRDQKRLTDNLNKTRQNIDTLRAHLDQRNIEFNKDFSKFNSSVNAKNESFKREFKHDTKEIGTALKDIFKDNVK
ncbi:hypothetical protein [Mucilaginibacter antarcticus]|uniref:Lipoprotein n=1 Tax=Mucilaginibacter antarcticus TaxID=1855725 RepID=A0ABW5XQK3_9SPHI